jgi:two-component system cell cycle sensor histidine kinase/response regulator CckA
VILQRRYNQATVAPDLHFPTTSLGLFFFLLAASIWGTRRAVPGYRRWTAAGLSVVLSLFLLALRGLASDWITIIAANTLLVIVSILYLEGAREFRGLRPRLWMPYAAGAVTIAGLAFYNYVVPSVNARISLISAFLGIVSMFTSATLLRRMPDVHKTGLKLAGGSFAFCAAIFMARALYFAFTQPVSDALALSGASGVFFGAMAVSTVGFSTGLILLADERVLADLEAAQDRAWRANQEVAEGRQAEATLRESEERFRTMADRAPVLIWVAGTDKLCTFFNKPWLEFRGRSMEQELGNGWTDGVHPEDLERCLSAYFSAFDARRNFQMEYRLQRADGDYRWVLDNGTPLYRDGEFAGFIGSCIDVTGQKLIEERLRASEVRLLETQRLAKIGSWEHDIAADRMEWSGEKFRFFGLAEGTPLNASVLLSYVHPEDRERFSDAERKVGSSSMPVDVEFRIVRPDGEVRLLHSVMAAIRNERGALVRMAGATQDITDIRRAQEEEFARQKLETVGTLANGIAHDFNNLLGGVMAQADLALAKLATGSPPEEELTVIREVAVRGSEIVRQLMLYAGQKSADVELVDVTEVVREMMGLLQVSVSKHASLETDLGQGLPSVRANVAQLSQIIMNLVTNASDALNDRDGKIRVTTRRVAVTAASSEGLADGDYVQVEVSDTGRGMSKETQAKVFEPFFSTKSAGRGLGLAVVHGIVGRLGGTIRVASEPGNGSVFQVILPCVQGGGAVAGVRPRCKGTLESSSTGTILVVEDEDALRQAGSTMLRRAGFSVIETADGSAALEAIRKQEAHIDALLLDISLPGVPSHEVLAEARLLRPEMKVIATSAYTEERASSLLRMPVDRFLQKPFRLADLVQMIRQTLAG